MARNRGYYWLHYTNLDTVNFGTKTGLGLAYYGFDNKDQWNLWVWAGNPGSGSGQITLQDSDSHIDHVYPQLAIGDKSAEPPSALGFCWIQPKEGWLIAWGRPNSGWSGLRKDLEHVAEFRPSEIALYGSSVSPP